MFLGRAKLLLRPDQVGAAAPPYRLRQDAQLFMTPCITQSSQEGAVGGRTEQIIGQTLARGPAAATETVALPIAWIWGARASSPAVAGVPPATCWRITLSQR